MSLSAPPAPFAPVSSVNSAAATDVVRQRRSQTPRAGLDPMVPVDEVSISATARKRQGIAGATEGDDSSGEMAGGNVASAGAANGATGNTTGGKSAADGKKSPGPEEGGPPELAAKKPAGPRKLSPQQEKVVAQLSARDREVRDHENAHRAAGGALAGSASYTYATGPDGRSYAVGGEVPIDVSPGKTPRETIERAQQVRAAALAPKQPSGQDVAVAASASSMEAEARAQLARAERRDRTEATEGSNGSSKSGRRAGETPAAGERSPTDAERGQATASSASEGASPRRRSPEYSETTAEAFIPMRTPHLHSSGGCGFCSGAVGRYMASAAAAA